MKKWYEMTKKELKEMVRKDLLEEIFVNNDIRVHHDDKKMQKAVSFLIESYLELSEDIPLDEYEAFREDMLLTIFDNVKLSSDIIGKLLDRYYDDDDVIYPLLKTQRLNEKNLEKFLKMGISVKDTWFLVRFHNLLDYPMLIIKHANLDDFPPEYLVNDIDWDKVFSEQLDPVAQYHLIYYLLDLFDRFYGCKGYEVYSLKHEPYCIGCFRDEDVLWDNTDMKKRVKNINKAKYYDAEHDILFDNFWYYLVYRFLETQENIDERLLDDIHDNFDESKYQKDFIKSLVDKYGEKTMKIFFDIYKKIKEDSELKGIEAILSKIG